MVLMVCYVLADHDVQAVGAAACLFLAAAALLLWKQGKAETGEKKEKAIISKEDAKTK